MLQTATLTPRGLPNTGLRSSTMLRRRLLYPLLGRPHTSTPRLPTVEPVLPVNTRQSRERPIRSTLVSVVPLFGVFAPSRVPSPGLCDDINIP